VKSCSEWAIANRALGSGRQSFATSRQWTPSKAASKRLQRVTQWMSCTLPERGSSFSSAHVSSSSCSTSPVTRNVHVARSTSGTLPACSTGHLSVRYWPGGSLAGS
jgi:hypothetical protein